MSQCLGCFESGSQVFGSIRPEKCTGRRRGKQTHFSILSKNYPTHPEQMRRGTPSLHPKTSAFREAYSVPVFSPWPWWRLNAPPAYGTSLLCQLSQWEGVAWSHSEPWHVKPSVGFMNIRTQPIKLPLQLQGFLSNRFGLVLPVSRNDSG